MNYDDESNFKIQHFLIFLYRLYFFVSRLKTTAFPVALLSTDINLVNNLFYANFFIKIYIFLGWT